MRLFNILMTPPPPIPSHPPTHPPHTHTYTLIGCYWQSIFYSPLFILYANPLHPLYTLEEILFVVKPLDHHLWIHFSFEYC